MQSCGLPRARGVRRPSVSEQLAQSTGPAGERERDCATDLQAPGAQLLALPPMRWLTSYRGLSLLHPLFSQTENRDTTLENHTRPVNVHYANCYYHKVY